MTANHWEDVNAQREHFNNWFRTHMLHKKEYRLRGPLIQNIIHTLCKKAFNRGVFYEQQKNAITEVGGWD